MDLIDKIKVLSNRVQETLTKIDTEEATKTAFIMPFINALGYDVFNPTEVIPEYSADVGIKKGEKVDFAILKNGSPIILIECKWCRSDLNEEKFSQLYRYFSVTKARFAVLTNGITYRFFTDSCEPNKLDSKHFFEFNLLNFQESEVDEIKKFSKNMFDVEKTYKTAVELKYIKEIKKLFSNELANPSDNLVKFFASQIYSGKIITKSVKDEYRDYVKKALNQYINDKINERFKNAIELEKSTEISGEMETNEKESKDSVKKTSKRSAFRKKESIEITNEGKEFTLSDPEIFNYKPTALLFNNEIIPIKHRRDMLIHVANKIIEEKPSCIDVLLNFRLSKKRKYFSKNPENLREPKKLLKEDLYIETNLNFRSIISIIKKILKITDYSENVVGIFSKPN